MAKRRYTKNDDPNHEGYAVPSSRPLKVPFAQFRFVRIELDEAEKTEFREMYSAGEYDRLEFDGLLREGYKLTVSYDVTHSTFIASLSGVYKDMPNAGLVLTGRGNSEAVARAVLMHKHSYVCSDELWTAIENSRGGSYSDIG